MTGIRSKCRLGLAGVAMLLFAGCTTQPVIKGSEDARSACEASTRVLSGELSLQQLPNAWRVGLPEDGAGRRAFVKSLSEGDAEDWVRRELAAWRESQAAGELRADFQFSHGVSAEVVAPEALAELVSRRALHADFARAMASSGIVEQQVARAGYRQSSGDAGFRVQGNRYAAGALFGVLVLNEVESYRNGRYQYAVLVAWSPEVEALYKGAALGCLGDWARPKNVSVDDMTQQLEGVLDSVVGAGVPTGGRKVVLENGTFGYIGFGAAAIDRERRSISEASQAAGLQARSNSLRAVFSELSLSSELDNGLQLGEQDFSTHRAYVERFDSGLAGVRLPGVSKLAETVMTDPLTGQEHYVVLAGVFPQLSERTAVALRQVIVDRFADRARFLDLR